LTDLPLRRRRVRHDIIMKILKAAKNGAKKSHIMLEARLSFRQLEKYLNHLSTAGFITEEPSRTRIWKTTEKGAHAIAACEICCRLVEETM